MSREILVYGAGGAAREAVWLVSGAGYVCVGFVDDAPDRAKTLIGLPVYSLEEAATAHPGCAMAVAVGSSKDREAMDDRARKAGFVFPTVCAPDVRRGPRVELGEGTLISAGSILTCDIRIGRHVQINLDCTITHDDVLEDFVTLAPGVHLSGNVHVRHGAFLGTGAVVKHGVPGRRLVIGAGAVVGAGACVVTDVEPGVTVVGVPARPQD